MFLNLDARFVFPTGILGAPKVGEVVAVEPWWPHGLLQKSEITFMDGCLYVASDAEARVKVVHKIPPGDYRPFISVCNPGMTLRVSVCITGKKRTSELDANIPLS